MKSPKFSTCFAPSDRSSPEEIKLQARYFFSDIFLVELLNFIPIIIMVLNSNRQLVFGNKTLLGAISTQTIDNVLGKRPGEVLNCRHHTKNEAGCGTTEFCQYCGAVNAILKSQQEGYSVSECRILAIIKGNEEAFDFRVWASQFEKNGEGFTLFSVVNIEDEKRRLFLERIFLHDISNDINAVLGFSNIAIQERTDTSIRKDFINRINLLSKRIAEEVKAHQQLIEAEYNQLELNLEQINSLELIAKIHSTYTPQILNHRFLEIDTNTESITFQTDRTLLTRVIGNMIKNALEASVPGETATIGCYKKNDRIYFWVHNPTYIPKNIRLQIFNRSFSTKDVNRGLGTYSMKYFTEKYLQGSIDFTSTEPEGTTFTANYPIRSKT